MADRLTQLQDAVNHQADNFCNSIGVLQMVACPTKFPDRTGPGGSGTGTGSNSQGNHNSTMGDSNRQQLTGTGTTGSNSNQNSGGASHLPPSQEDLTLTFSTMIARCAKDIDNLVDSLPSEDSSTELQLASLRRLEQENLEASHKLKEAILRGEAVLDRIRSALSDIAQAQIEMQNLVNDPFLPR